MSLQRLTIERNAQDCKLAEIGRRQASEAWPIAGEGKARNRGDAISVYADEVESFENAFPNGG